ncbi:MAG: CapA family protein [Candidatus Aminicenantes bacterium]|nr:CapA family protein [Candidatus Aminicenantes bacterium]
MKNHFKIPASVIRIERNGSSSLQKGLRFLRAAAVAFVLVNFLNAALQQADPGSKDPKRLDPKRPLAKELEMSVADGFTLTAVGDCILSRRASQYLERDSGFAELVKILRSSDAACGNLETSILDIKEFKGYPFSWEGDWTLVSMPDVAADLAALGFDLFSCANNHALDWGIEGMRETGRRLDEAGLTHAGTGDNLGKARAAMYFESSKGRIGIVSTATSFRPTSDALPPEGAAPGRPGVNPLNVKKNSVVPAQVMKLLAEVQTAFNPGKSVKSEKQPPRELSLFGIDYELGEACGYRYEMDSDDLAEILKSIRQGKQNSDFLIAAVHSHESSSEVWPEPPAAFLQELARAAVDGGADAFVTTGHHHLGPIEIYKGKPVFYGLGNFFWSDIQEPLPADLHRRNRELLKQAFQYPERATDADLTAVLNAKSFNNDLTFQSIIAECRFRQGGIEEIRLYPVDLGYGRTLTESGLPRTASPEKAQEILKRLQKLSRPYGTEILIENNVGIIHSSPAEKKPEERQVSWGLS